MSRLLVLKCVLKWVSRATYHSGRHRPRLVREWFERQPKHACKSWHGWVIIEAEVQVEDLRGES